MLQQRIALSFLVVATACSGPAVTAVASTDFDADAPDRVPAGFVAAQTNGAGRLASWTTVAGDAAHGNVVRVDTANSGATFNLLLSAAPGPADLMLGVDLRAVSGTEDQGGGLAWRAQDAANYYCARWNPLEDNLRLYKVVDGERTMLAGTELTATRDGWHRLEVEMRGTRVKVAFDGRWLLAADDTTFAAAGRYGLWTKADASTAFDALVVGAVR
ncbi:MAG: hypothetical protein U1E73_03735 [Planctomycetota bacterium]